MRRLAARAVREGDAVLPDAGRAAAHPLDAFQHQRLAVLLRPLPRFPETSRSPETSRFPGTPRSPETPGFPETLRSPETSRFPGTRSRRIPPASGARRLAGAGGRVGVHVRVASLTRSRENRPKL
ncbi:hypothetical protein GCM10010140_69580 [Streptosporangium pseudovulgare]|uniref:Uncharacterized protein n=1 Tax=Streptosporangium pseudovulgare TaxID=35765 RepID=A0ABQ2RJA4_9ACTN|nr:hypothetical protein GCM10010140_69580 [Streptosporangium pseudovulgare]